MLNLKQIRDLEENENGFFSLWTRSVRIDGVLVLYNRIFAEDPLFNHATILQTDEEEISVLAQRIAKFYRSKGVTPAIYAPVRLEQSRLERIMAKLKFQIYDELYVMKRGAEEPQHPMHVTVKQTSMKDLEDWVNVYMAAFEIPEGWRREIYRRSKRILRAGSSLLLSGYLNDKPAGTLAMYFSSGLAGLYCIGTLPELRGRGIASSIISASARLALDKGCEAFCLQTLKKDGLLGFYQRFGFRFQYAKTIYIASSTEFSPEH